MAGCVLLAAPVLPANAQDVQRQDVLAAPACRTDRILARPAKGLPGAVIDDFHRTAGSRVRRKFPRIRNWELIQLSPGSAVAEKLDHYRRSGLFERVEPDYAVKALVEPNDFRFWDGSLWGLKNAGIHGGVAGADIDAPNGWDTQSTASNIIVAVVDTGVRYTHEDLAPNMWVNPGESGLDASGQDKRANGIDDDGNGWIDDVHGVNVLNGTGDPNDDHGHGTHVAGIIGGMGNNNVGVAGVCWRVQIMACKFIYPDGNGHISDAMTCIDYALSKGAKIINASWGSYTFTSSALRDAVDRARDRGVIFVAATGNDGNNNEAIHLYPACYEYDNIIAVAATDRTDELAFFSNRGANTVDLGAPGHVIFSCWSSADNAYQYYSGTSMAAPHVAGVCALVWQRHPGSSHHQVIRRVLAGAEPLPGLAGKCVTGGRLNLPNALRVELVQSAEASVWFDDALPAGAQPGFAGDAGGWSSEAWNWIADIPAPFSGSQAHQSGLFTGIHGHYFTGAAETMPAHPGDRIFTHVYLDPENPPRELMLCWTDGCWEHRAYWGEDMIPWGAHNTSGRRRMGGLPPAGQWVRLEVPVEQVGLAGATIKGMGFLLFNGRATWDRTGRLPGGSPEQ